MEGAELRGRTGGRPGGWLYREWESAEVRDSLSGVRIEMKFNYYLSSFLWAFVSKMSAALISFVSIPLLLHYFGKERYGVLTLALAINLYLRFFDLGLNPGSINYFAKWRAAGKFGRFDRVARTSLSFYGLIGLACAIILLLLQGVGGSIFRLSPEGLLQLRPLLLQLAAFALINWVGNVFTQLLIATQQLAYTQRMLLLRSVLELAAAGVTVWWRLSLSQYFLLFMLCPVPPILLSALRCRHGGLLSSLMPQWYWGEFKTILSYSIWLFLMSFFQFSALQLRPIILSIWSPEAETVLTDYRLIEVFPLFILSLGGALLPIMLPKAAEHLQRRDRKAVEQLAYQGSRYCAVLITLLCVPTALAAPELLTLVSGSTAYAALAFWLRGWCAVLLLSLPISPVSSLILASGKVRILIVSSMISCVISLIVNIWLCERFGLGSAVIGYGLYVVMQISFLYAFLVRRLLDLNPFRVMGATLIPTALGVVVFFPAYYLRRWCPPGVFGAALVLAVWCAGYLGLLNWGGVLQVGELWRQFRRRELPSGN